MFLKPDIGEAELCFTASFGGLRCGAMILSLAMKAFISENYELICLVEDAVTVESPAEFEQLQI